MKKLEADYLVIGTGAVGMTFVDVMLDQSDATFVMVDRHHLPGGHWNDAYSFVRLHQPSAFYGVASTDLGSNRIDETGFNKGFHELASGAEISAYFETLMRERFLSSGRVQYFPMCNYDGGGKFHALLSGEQYEVAVGRKIVDGTFFNTTVPSMHTRKFTVDEGVTCVSPNELPRLAADHKHFTVLGGGKTAMDTCVWLLEHGATPDSITWVCPRDSWMINRESTQPGAAFFEKVVGGFAANLEAMGQATSVEDLFARMEAAGTMLRIDPTITPTMYHYATISEGELEQLRRLNTIIRGERVSRIEADQLVMRSGETISATPQTLYINCTARAVDFKAETTKPIFEASLITLQTLFAPLVTYSAAVIAYVEANFETDEEKNGYCTPVELADTPEEWMGSTLGSMINTNAWSQNKALKQWTRSCRLNPNAAAVREGAGKDPAHKALTGRIRQNMLPAVMNIQKLMAELPKSE
ncbi:MAG: NAD(P)/FAD-dependent oxidoreductase [Chloroflexota bacterium]